jgi:large subunit ribosomal protein L1
MQKPTLFQLFPYSQAMPKQPKKHSEKSALVKEQEYTLDEAVDLLTQVSTTKFDGTAEVHVRLFTDPSQGDQQVRSTVSLPHGTGKDLRIAAVVPEDMAKEVKAAGAVLAGEKSVIEEIEKGNIDFDVLVAVPTLMRSLGKVAKTLGQRGLMPNPKAGTVSDNPVQAITELKKGRIEIRADKQSIIHSIFGKISFGKEKLAENLRTLLQAVQDAKPSGVKGEYIRTISIAPSMGPGIRLQTGSL